MILLSEFRLAHAQQSKLAASVGWDVGVDLVGRSRLARSSK